jgi:hypothetical protein
MVKEQALGHPLQNVHQVVVPPDMRQFVRQQRLYLLGCEPRQHAQRGENHGAKPADDQRSVHSIRGQ